MAVKAAILLREQRRPVARMIAHTLGATPAVSTAQAAQNVADSRAWLAAHPLPANASPDMIATRQLVVAAVNAAASKLADGAAQADARAALSRAQAVFAANAAAQHGNEMPSGPFAALDNLSDSVKTALKYAAIGGALWLGVKLVGAARGR